jgi:hypothetical protein
MGTGSPFPGDKARPGHDADNSPPSSAKVENQWELYLLPPTSLYFSQARFYLPEPPLCPQRNVGIIDELLSTNILIYKKKLEPKS